MSNTGPFYLRTRQGGAAPVLEPFATLEPANRAVLNAEGEAMLRWAENEAASHAIRWAD